MVVVLTAAVVMVAAAVVVVVLVLPAAAVAGAVVVTVVVVAVAAGIAERDTAHFQMNLIQYISSPPTDQILGSMPEHLAFLCIPT